MSALPYPIKKSYFTMRKPLLDRYKSPPFHDRVINYPLNHKALYPVIKGTGGWRPPISGGTRPFIKKGKLIKNTVPSNLKKSTQTADKKPPLASVAVPNTVLSAEKTKTLKMADIKSKLLKYGVPVLAFLLVSTLVLRLFKGKPTTKK